MAPPLSPDAAAAPPPPLLSPPPPPPSPVTIAVRQATITETLGTITPVPALYGSLYGSPSPGAVAGIVLGSVAAFLLLLALIYTCCRFSPGSDSTTSSWVTPSISLRSRGRQHRSPSRRRSRSRRRSKHRVSRTSETVEVRTSSRRPPSSSSRRPAAIIVEGGPGGRGRGVDRDSEVEEVMVVRDGRRRSSVGRPVIAVPVPPRVVHGSDSEDNEVVVVEENLPPQRRSTSRRNSAVYRESRRY